jgi:hypothetical protein
VDALVKVGVAARYELNDTTAAERAWEWVLPPLEAERQTDRRRSVKMAARDESFAVLKDDWRLPALLKEFADPAAPANPKS